MGSMEHLEAIVRAGEAIDRGIAELERGHLKALADRLDLDHDRPTSVLQISIRRRLIGLPRPR